MKDRVGEVVPSEKQVQDLVKEARALQDKMAKFAVSLTKEERQATTKFRPGGEKIVALVADLAEKHKLSLPNISVDGMKADLKLAQALQPLAAALESVVQTASDTILEAQSECWWATTAYYSALARMIASDPKLESELRPAIDFFATRRRRARPTAPAPA